MSAAEPTILDEYTVKSIVVLESRVLSSDATTTSAMTVIANALPDSVILRSVNKSKSEMVAVSIPVVAAASVLA